MQRSMSSPEFQAELMQVARKVRNKLNCGGRSSVESSANVASLERKSDNSDRCAKDTPKVVEETTKRPEKRSARHEEGTRAEECAIEDRIVEERRLIERCNRSDSKSTGTTYEERKGGNARDPARTKDYLDERQQGATEVGPGGSGGKRRHVEKSATFDESSSAARPRDPLRKDSKERLDGSARGRSAEERYPSERERRELIEDYQRAKGVARGGRKYDDAADGSVVLPENQPTRPCDRDRAAAAAYPRGQGSGRESTPERTEAKEREKENSDRRWRKSDARNTDATADEKGWPEPVPAMEKKDARSKERLARKPEAKEAREKNWHV